MAHTKKQTMRIDSTHVTPVDRLTFGTIEQYAQTLEATHHNVYRSKVRIFEFSRAMPWECVSVRRPTGWSHLIQDHESAHGHHVDVRQIDTDDLVDAINQHIAEKYPHFTR